VVCGAQLLGGENRMEHPKFSRGCKVLFVTISMLVGCVVSNVFGLFDSSDPDSATEDVEITILWIIPEPMFKNLEGIE
jgi:hypothetical protein